MGLVTKPVDLSEISGSNIFEEQKKKSYNFSSVFHEWVYITPHPPLHTYSPIPPTYVQMHMLFYGRKAFFDWRNGGVWHFAFMFIIITGQPHKGAHSDWTRLFIWSKSSSSFWFYLCLHLCYSYAKWGLKYLPLSCSEFWMKKGPTLPETAWSIFSTQNGQEFSINALLGIGCFI